MQKFFVYLMGLVIVLSGCYTVIKHPKVKKTQDSKFSHEVYFTDNCVSCHGNTVAELHPASKPYLPRLDYIRENNRWNYFYQYPWWYRSMFSQYSGAANAGDQGDDFLPTTSSRPRFPGSGNSGNRQNNSRWISGGSGSSSSTKATRNRTQDSVTDENKNSSVRGKSSNKSNARKATRGSGESGSNSDDSKKANRRKKK